MSLTCRAKRNVGYQARRPLLLTPRPSSREISDDRLRSLFEICPGIRMDQSVATRASSSWASTPCGAMWASRSSQGQLRNLPQFLGPPLLESQHALLPGSDWPFRPVAGGWRLPNGGSVLAPSRKVGRSFRSNDSGAKPSNLQNLEPSDLPPARMIPQEDVKSSKPPEVPLLMPWMVVGGGVAGNVSHAGSSPANSGTVGSSPVYSDTPLC